MEYLLQVCDAVAEAHRAGIVHRDLKLANVFLTSRSNGSPCIKVLDFGIAKISDPSEAELTHEGMVGSLKYMSPEQILRSKTADWRTDIWALGMIAYEFVTAKPAFPATSQVDLISAIMEDEPAPPSVLRHDLSPAIEAIILKCLRKNRQERFQSVDDFSVLRLALCATTTARVNAPMSTSKSKPQIVPCRVHIILARKAPVAIAIRRGPSKRVCTVGWDRTKDSFQVGQWIKGRIYERRCDLSPTGRHFIYFAMNGKWKTQVKGSWTAISMAPYLKAVGLWANGSGWNGGGLFTSDKQYWLNAFPFGHEVLRTPRGLEQDAFPFHEGYGGECPGVYYVRLQRDGWRLVRHEREGADHPTIFEKQVAMQWILEKTAHETSSHTSGRGCYFDTHRLKKIDGSMVLDLPEWEWADVDGTRLVWVTGGVLYAGRIVPEGLTNTKPLFDFNSLTFKALKAPY